MTSSLGLIEQKPWLIAANLVDSTEDLTKLILLWRTRGKNQGYNRIFTSMLH